MFYLQHHAGHIHFLVATIGVQGETDGRNPAYDLDYWIYWMWQWALNFTRTLGWLSQLVFLVG